MFSFRSIVLLACLASAASHVVGQSNAPWEMQQSGTTAGLRGIDSADGTIAWASGTAGTVLRTLDGGAHWQRCATPDADKDGATLDFRGVQAWDEKTAIVMASGPGDKSRLYKTTDGCKTWKLLLKNEGKDGFWDSIGLWTPTDGFLAGDPVDGHPVLSEFTSYNGIFFDNELYAFEARHGEASFAASNSILSLGPFRTAAGTSREVWFATGGASGARVIHYQHFNGGEPERVACSVADVRVFPATNSGGIFSLDFRDDQHGIAVGGDYTKPNEPIGHRRVLRRWRPSLDRLHQAASRLSLRCAMERSLETLDHRRHQRLRYQPR